VPAIGGDDAPVNLGRFVDDSLYRGNIDVGAVTDHRTPFCSDAAVVSGFDLKPTAVLDGLLPVGHLDVVRAMSQGRSSS
jgi:hypothetical protein